jgi:hypothetical protein
MAHRVISVRCGIGRYRSIANYDTRSVRTAGEPSPGFPDRTKWGGVQVLQLVQQHLAFAIGGLGVGGYAQ